MELDSTADAFIALSKKVNAPLETGENEEDQPEKASPMKIITLDSLRKTTSEFVIESLMMKV